jgi:methylenetetrahydrofolate dehydrogenase (NADP+)/methenyltetrahydrofolate cyclohydrolase
LGQVIVPHTVAKTYRDQIRAEVEALGEPLNLVGFLASDFRPSVAYADYTRVGCERVGIGFERRRVAKYDLERAVAEANLDAEVHGILIYYPVFGVEQDNYIKDQIDPKKDAEGLSTYWLRRLYQDDRIDEVGHKAILPCTPLAILKLLEAAGAMSRGDAPLGGQTVAVFNRSEVVGRPLASMLAHDGARVLSFDINGVVQFDGKAISESSVSRSDALRAADIVITGVPSEAFPLIRPEEFRPETICLNFSHLKNFTPEAAEKARIFIPRVGPMTVTMALRNTLRLYSSYHAPP